MKSMIGTVRLRTGERKRRPVLGILVGPHLAVTPSLDVGGAWCVTHVRTGLAAVPASRPFKTPQAAIMAAELLAGLDYDWSKVRRPAYLMPSDQMAEAVQRCEAMAIQSWEDEA